MPDIKYHFALEGDEYIPIEEVDRGERHAHTYKCIGCGAEMIARIGQKNAPHFAHKGNDENCSSETYLHKLAKRLIRKKFESPEPLKIKYNRYGKCSGFSKCPFHDKFYCQVSKNSDYDLKKYYDTCQEEAPIKGYIADLLLSNSKRPEWDPVLIEIQVSHPSTEEKLNSGLKIIEIKINSEEDIISLLQNGTITENYGPHLYLERSIKRRISFHNFNKDPGIGERIIPRFILYSSGKFRIAWNESCHTVKQKIDPKSIFEVSIIMMDFSDELVFKNGYVIALQHIPDFKSCKLCKYYNILYDMCNLYNKFGTPQNPQPNHAYDCDYHRLNDQLIKEIKLSSPKYVIATE